VRGGDGYLVLHGRNGHPAQPDPVGGESHRKPPRQAAAFRAELGRDRTVVSSDFSYLPTRTTISIQMAVDEVTWKGFRLGLHVLPQFRPRILDCADKSKRGVS
jgi:hypothetical protein